MSKPKKLLLSLLFAFAFLLTGAVISGKAYALWFNPNWGFRQMITINSSQVPGDLTNFPVLVSVTDPTLGQMPNGNVGNADGSDILFTLFDGFTQLNHEIESYNPATGQLIAWVQVQNVSSAADTILYMYYGNAGASDQQNVNATWDSNYKGVWHLHNPASPATDSTINSNDGTQSGGVIFGAAGQINSAAGFDTIDDNLNAGDPGNSSLDFGTGAFSIELWIKRSGSINSWKTLVSKDSDPPGWRILFTGPPSPTPNSILFMTRMPGGGGSGDGLTSTATITDTNIWHHLVFTRDALGNKKIYIDGNADLSTSNDTSYDVSSGANFYFGFALDSFIDEIRASNIELSPDWILASYNNQNNPSSFLGFAAREIFVPVPAMTQWGMIIFMMFAGLVSVYYLRRSMIKT